MPEVLDESYAIFKIFERRQTAYYLCNSNGRNGRLRGLPVARILTEVTINREQMVSNFFQKMWDNTPFPHSTHHHFDPDQKKRNNQKIT